mmetsp:Transcript_140879/g.351227  ORF Transcript_140879/g.351227 Transcript_140879/m.351227 type:complete len:274 (+) Transcript_140879:1368-2189(+)
MAIAASRTSLRMCSKREHTASMTLALSLSTSCCNMPEAARRIVSWWCSMQTHTLSMALLSFRPANWIKACTADKRISGSMLTRCLATSRMACELPMRTLTAPTSRNMVHAPGANKPSTLSPPGLEAQALGMLGPMYHLWHQSKRKGSSGGGGSSCCNCCSSSDLLSVEFLSSLRTGSTSSSEASGFSNLSKFVWSMQRWNLTCLSSADLAFEYKPFSHLFVKPWTITCSPRLAANLANAACAASLTDSSRSATRTPAASTARVSASTTSFEMT